MFSDKHRTRAGLVTNQPEWLTDNAPIDKDRPFVSVTVCARGECQAKAIKYVAGETNETATYVPDADRLDRQ